MKNIITTTALALAASGLAVTAVPASAVDFTTPGYSAAPAEDGWNRDRRDRWRDRYDDRRDRRYYSRDGYGEPVYRNTRVWRGDDGRTYCRKKNGTTGLIIGGAAGALLGREVAEPDYPMAAAAPPGPRPPAPPFGSCFMRGCAKAPAGQPAGALFHLRPTASPFRDAGHLRRRT